MSHAIPSSSGWAATFTLNRLRAPVDADMDALAEALDVSDAGRVCGERRILRGIRERGEPLPDRLARAHPIRWMRGRFPQQSAWLAKRVDVDSPRGFGLSVLVIAGAACGWIFIGLTQDVFAHEGGADPGHGAAGRLLPGPRSGLEASRLPDRCSGRCEPHVSRREVMVGRPRPPVSLHLIRVSGFSFPSGHATAVVVCWGMAAVLLGSGRTTRVRVVLWAGAAQVAVLVGLFPPLPRGPLVDGRRGWPCPWRSMALRARARVRALARTIGLGRRTRGLPRLGQVNSRLSDLLLAPSVERVIHRSLEFNLPMILRPVQDAEAACDGRESRPLRGSVQIL